ncbi:MAG: DUF1552 domain-containing protein [Vicinamibacterales bacterium]|jgi:hypothetical protein|nr:DUF1552 domain-containing protein [Vicinamibacterales bacterium]
MIITKMSLPRRTVLRGLGAALSLPLLDAMVPALSALSRTAATAPRRFGVVYVPNGIAMEHWTPEKEGRGFELTPILQPLAPFKDQMTVVSGLRGYWTPAHAGASTTFLTGAAGVAGETAPVADISMDQILAKEYGQHTELASLQLSIDSRANAGQCSGGHSCVYTNTICWRSQTTPLPMENNPRVVFEQMFGDTGSTDPVVRLARMQRDRSILDSVTDKVSDLRREVGQADSLKIDEYLEGVRDIERRIQTAEQQDSFDMPEVVQPEGIPATFAEHVALMFDLQLLAHQTDLTRVSTFMMGREVSSRTYTEIGIPDAHHPLSHHEYDPERIAMMAKINTYHASLFADYVAKLRATPDGDGSLLDNMLLLYGCGMSDSNAHSPLNLPVVLLGGCGGQLDGGRHLSYDGDPLMPNLLVTLTEKLGVPVERLGKSDGTLSVEPLAGV